MGSFKKEVSLLGCFILLIKLEHKSTTRIESVVLDSLWSDGGTIFFRNSI